MFVIQQELVVTSRPVGAQKIDTRPEASASPENLLKMQILSPDRDLLNQKLVVGPTIHGLHTFLVILKYIQV